MVNIKYIKSVSNLFYSDDVKLYAEREKITCLNLKGKALQGRYLYVLCGPVKCGNISINTNITFEGVEKLSSATLYKYLGINQKDAVNHKKKN